MTDNAPKPIMGRPSKYDPAFCDKVIEWGNLGKSKAWICAELEIVDNTLRNWEAEYPDFLQAMEIAGRKSQQWWEDAGQNGMLAKSIDGPMWSRSMAARFPKDWREKSDNTTTLNAGDGALELMALISGKTRSI